MALNLSLSHNATMKVYDWNQNQSSLLKWAVDFIVITMLYYVPVLLCICHWVPCTKHASISTIIVNKYNYDQL